MPAENYCSKHQVTNHDFFLYVIYTLIWLQTHLDETLLSTTVSLHPVTFTNESLHKIQTLSLFNPTNL